MNTTKGMHIMGIMQFESWSVANKSLQFYKKELFPIKGRIVRSTSPIKKPETSSLSHSCLRFNDCRQPNYNGKTEVAFFHSFTVYSDFTLVVRTEKIVTVTCLPKSKHYEW